jgi:hypothetical protein
LDIVFDFKEKPFRVPHWIPVLMARVLEFTEELGRVSIICDKSLCTLKGRDGESIRY